MQAVKAIYKEGHIHLLSPLVGVSEADLIVIVLDRDDKMEGMAKSFRTGPSTSEEEFQAIGLASFFDIEDDSNIDWEDVFDVKPR